jgi:hypothetical protein
MAQVRRFHSNNRKDCTEMFYARGFEAPKNHIDFSFRNTDDWTVVGPQAGSPPSLWIMLGDPVSGPAIQLGTCPPLDETIWIDTHYHATDQYRCVMSGAYLLQRKKNMKCGDFTLHKSGVPYREGPAGGSPDPLWIVTVQGDKRGARSTATRRDATFPLVVGEDQLDGKVGTGLVDDPYWDTVPGGARGKSAIATTAGRSIGGFTWGNYDDRQDWQALGDGVEGFFAVFGDIDSGPFVMTAHGEGGALLVPALECASEIAIFVVSGSIEVAGKTYGGGDIRIQSASAELPPVMAGVQGANISVMIADRRADIATDDSEWLERVLEARTELTQSALENLTPA